MISSNSKGSAGSGTSAEALEQQNQPCSTNQDNKISIAAHPTDIASELYEDRLILLNSYSLWAHVSR